MKARNYDFAVTLRKGPMRTKREILDSLKQFARANRTESFTQKQYDRWPERVLCGSQIAKRFGTWARAMQQAGLAAQWDVTKNLPEMVEVFMDCWQEHDDPPTARVLEHFLQQKGFKYTVNMYIRYFGGIRRLAKRVSDFHTGRISEAQLVARYKTARTQRRPLPPAVRAAALKRDGFCCVRCRSIGPLEVHHKRAVADDGSNDLANLETLCEPCHVGEHATRPG